MTDLRILTPEEVETYWDSDTLISAADIAQSHEALRAKLTEAELDRDTRSDRLREISDLLADAGVSGGVTLAGGVIELRERAERAERQRDEARAKLATVEAERDRFQEWARGNRDEAEKAWARCHNAEAALAQMREALRAPTAVHAMLLRGDIARPSDANLRHLYPEWEQAESRCAALEALLSEARTAMEPLTAVQIRRHRTDPLLASRIDAALADAAATPTATGDE